MSTPASAQAQPRPPESKTAPILQPAQEHDVYYVDTNGEVTWDCTQPGTNEIIDKLNTREDSPETPHRPENGHGRCKLIERTKWQRNTVLDPKPPLTIIRLDVFFKVKPLFDEDESHNDDQNQESQSRDPPNHKDSEAPLATGAIQQSSETTDLNGNSEQRESEPRHSTATTVTPEIPQQPSSIAGLNGVHQIDSSPLENIGSPETTDFATIANSQHSIKTESNEVPHQPATRPLDNMESTNTTGAASIANSQQSISTEAIDVSQESDTRPPLHCTLTNTSWKSVVSKDERTGISPPWADIPDRYHQKLKGFCSRCAFRSKILWRNVTQAESRYETRFRTYQDEIGTCFLQFHTLQVPYLEEDNLILALLHHVYIPAQNLEHDTPQLEHGTDERVFAFVLGLSTEEIEELLNKEKIIANFMEEENNDTRAGLTPKLFIAGILKLYGFNYTKNSIKKALKLLKNIDNTLSGATVGLKENNSSHGDLESTIAKCKELTTDLRGLGPTLTGVRSRLHYIGLCARGLMREESAMENYIIDEWSRVKRQHENKPEPGKTGQANTSQSHGPTKTSSGIKRKWTYQDHETFRKDLKLTLSDLESVRYTRRDKDKLDVISRAMMQYEVDIKSLKARTTIAVGMVANLYSHSLLDASERDGYKMKVIAILTIFFLPATFFAIVFTTLMVTWPEHALPPDPDPKGPGKDWSHPTFVMIPIIIYVSLAICSTIIIMFFIWRDKIWRVLELLFPKLTARLAELQTRLQDMVTNWIRRVQHSLEEKREGKLREREKAKEDRKKKEESNNKKEKKEDEEKNEDGGASQRKTFRGILKKGRHGHSSGSLIHPPTTTSKEV